MPFLPRAINFVRNVFQDARRDGDLDAEIQSTLALLTDQKVAQGMAPDEARRAAIIELGGVEQVKENVRAVRAGAWLDSLLQDVRFALRMLRKAPGFAVVAILTVALGIGANTAIFSIVNSVLLRQLPYKNPSRLVWVTDFLPKTNQSFVLDFGYAAWRKQNRSFTEMAAYRSSAQYTLTGEGEPERLSAAKITASFLDVLDVKPRLGRNFSADEDRPNGPPVVLLSDALWRSRFSADPNIIGKIISLDGRAYTVVGVMPPQFEFLDNARPDAFVPFALSDAGSAFRPPFAIVNVIARLRPGISIAVAADELNAINRRLQPAYPGGFASMMAGQQAQVISLHDHSVGNVRTALFVLLGAVGFVLLIACVNVANLQLARAVSRTSEMAVRAALGAGRSRIVRQLFTESALVAVCGGIAGLFLAIGLLDLVRSLGPANIPHLAGSQLDLRVLLFTLGASLATGILSGLAPARLGADVSLGNSLKEGNVRTGAGASAQRSQRALCVAEIALALILFVGAGLLLRSFVRLISVPSGFDAHNVLTAQISLPVSAYGAPARQRAFFSQLVARVQSLPGVSAAGAASTPPLRGFLMSAGIVVDGQRQETRGPVGPSAAVNIVSPDYFAALHIPLREGRSLNGGDVQDQPDVLLVNQSFVLRFFPNENPLGHQIQIGGEQTSWTIVGVVGDYKQTGLAADVTPEVFATL